jgi:hypothetical protein
MMTKKEQRLRRARQTRLRIAQQGSARLTVFRSNLHIYARAATRQRRRSSAGGSPSGPGPLVSTGSRSTVRVSPTTAA